MRAFVGAVLIVLVGGIACGSAAGTLRSGLYGKVTKGPLRPVCIEGVPCNGPAAGLTLVFRRDGVVAARTKTRTDGSYRVALKPGRYTVGAVPRAMQPPQPQRVRVPRHAFGRVDFFVDTGIR